MVVKIVPNDKGNPPGKLADAELHFTDGVLDGLKLIGFAIWERRSGAGRNVTFPSRQYTVNGERRSFALLRPIADAAHRNASGTGAAGLRRARRASGGRLQHVSRSLRTPLQGGVRHVPVASQTIGSPLYGFTESRAHNRFDPDCPNARISAQLWRIA